MGFPLKWMTTVVTMVCAVSAVAVAGSLDPERSTDSSANQGKWWIESARAKSRQRALARSEAVEPAWEERQPGASAIERETYWPEPVVARLMRYGYEFVEHLTPHFQLMYRPQRRLDPALVDQTGALLEEAYRKFFADFEQAGFVLQPIHGRLPWYVFDDDAHYHDFARAADGMDAPYLESYYAARSNQVVLMQATGLTRWLYKSGGNTQRDYFQTIESSTSRTPGVSGMDEPARQSERGGAGGMLDVRRAVHEAAHQLAFNTGLQKRGVMYPLWVSEGLATNFESDTAHEIGMAGENAPRQRQLLRAHADGRLMPLESFITLVHIRPGGPYGANDLYAQSWAFFNWLYKTRQAELKRYLATLAQLEPGPRDTHTMRREFTHAFGSLDRIERAWSRHLDSLRRQ